MQADIDVWELSLLTVMTDRERLALLRLIAFHCVFPVFATALPDHPGIKNLHQNEYLHMGHHKQIRKIYFLFVRSSSGKRHKNSFGFDLFSLGKCIVITKEFKIGRLNHTLVVYNPILFHDKNKLIVCTVWNSMNNR